MVAERKKSVTGRSLRSKLKRKAARRYKSPAAASPPAPLASLLEPLEPRLLLDGASMEPISYAMPNGNSGSYHY